MKKKFRIVSSQLIYHETYVMAKSEDDAQQQVLDDNGAFDWNECQYGDWDIEDIEEIKP